MSSTPRNLGGIARWQGLLIAGVFRQHSKRLDAQERGGASPPVRCVKVVRYEPAGLRPAALAIASLLLVMLTNASQMLFNEKQMRNQSQ